jgi:two-component system, NtrC family, sensor kinase
MSLPDRVETAPGVRHPHATTLRQLRAVRLGAVDMLAAGVAHEVNNPLAFVSANVTLLGQGIQLCARAMRGEPLSESERADLDFLLAEGDQVARETADGCARIGDVVRRLAAFTERGDGFPVDLPRITLDVAKMLQSGARGRLDLQVEWSPVPQLRGNPARIAHALFAFIEHAREACRRPTPGPARFGVRLLPGDLGAAAVLEIWDNGPLLTAAERDLFEDPFQATGPERTVALGLALAREIVREHGGAVVLAENPGGGNLRRVIFPAVAG